MSKSKYVVKRSRSLRVGGEVTKGADGKPVKAKSTTYGPGQEVSLDKERGEELVRRGFLTRPGTEAATAAREQADELPDDLPGREKLIAAGYDTRSKVASLSKAQLVEIDGIGEKTADDIQKGLKG